MRTIVPSSIPFPRPKTRWPIVTLMGMGLSALAGHAQTYTERDIGIFRVPINDWNMQTTRNMEIWLGAYSSFPLPSGIDASKIIGASVIIYNDAQTQAIPLMFLAASYNGIPHDWQRGGHFALSCQDLESPATARCVVKLDRGPDDANYFSKYNSGADYDAAGFRGWITLEHLGAPTNYTRIYRKIGSGFGIPSALVSPRPYIDKTVALSFLAPNPSMLDMDATLHSDPPSGSPSSLWVEPLGIAGAPTVGGSASEFSGRGGMLWGTPKNLSLHVPYSHTTGNAAGLKSRFHKGLHTSSSNNRGWVRITTESPQSYTNPNFVKTRVMALGPRVLSQEGSGSMVIPLSSVTKMPQDRVVELSGFIFKDPVGGLSIRDASPFGRMPPLTSPTGGGGPKIGGKIQLKPDGNIHMHYSINSPFPPYLPMEYFWTNWEHFDDPSFNNRGWLRVDYLAAQCGEGGGFTRAAIGYTGSGDDCHGNYYYTALNRSNHVIQTKGNRITQNSTSDAFYFAHKSLASWTSLEVKVDKVENTSTTVNKAKAGLMMRAGSSTSAPTAGGIHLSLLVTSDNEVQLIRRTSTNGQNQYYATMVGATPPYKLRLTKEANNNYKAEVIMPDGSVSWLATANMPNVSYRVGVAASNGDAGTNLCTAGLSEGNF